MTGAGVTAQLASGQTVQVGKFEFVAPDQAKQSQTQTTVYIGIDGRYAGYITVYRPSSPGSASNDVNAPSARFTALNDAHRGSGDNR